MARRVSTEDIRQMNEVYYRCKSYAETARQTGWSASTVSKYIDKNFVPVCTNEIRHFEGTMPDFNLNMFTEAESIGELFVLTADEIEEVKELWKELVV